MGPTHIHGALSSGVDRPWHEADHSPPSNANVINDGRYTFTLSVCLHGMYINNFTFLPATETGRPPTVINVMLNSVEQP